MSDRKFSHYVVSLSGEKGKGPWLAVGAVSHHVTPDLPEAKDFDTRKEARDLLGWARIEYGPEAKVMAVYVRSKASPRAEGDTYEAWVLGNEAARAIECASRDSEAAIEFATRFDLANNTSVDVKVRRSGQREISAWRVELNGAGWIATRCDGGVGLEYRRVKP